MSKTVKGVPPVAEEGVNLPFEEALKKLEGIVETMESEDLPLEALLVRYQEGTKLVQTCQTRLADAEVRIQQLERTSSGEFALKTFPSGQKPSEPAAE